MDEVNWAPNLMQSELDDHIDGTNQNVAHAAFVAGVRNGTTGFKCVSGEPYQFIRGVRQLIFIILVLLYVVAPAIFIPLWAWHEHRWLLLSGIVVSAIATRIASSLLYKEKKQYAIGTFLLIGSVISFFCFGIHNYFTFFLLCALWGLMFFMMANNAERDYAIQSLVENRLVFEDAIAQKTILIVRKEDETL